MTKELKSERITIRCTPSQRQRLENEAKKYDMPLSSYCTDKLINGKMRVSYAKRKACTVLVRTGIYLDEITHLIETTNTEYISKQTIIQPLNNAQKEISKIWKY